MQQVVYADVLVFVNIFVNYFLLRATEGFLHTGASTPRLIAGAVAGGIYSLTLFLPEHSLWLTLAMKALFLAFLVYLVFRASCLRRFAVQSLCFLAVNFIFAGVMLFVRMVFSTPGMVFYNGAVYFDVSVPSLIICTFIGFSAAKLFSRAVRRKTPDDREYELVIAVGYNSVKLKSLLDTGNTLTDGFGARPVIIANYDSLYGLFDADAREFFSNSSELPSGSEWAHRVRMVPYKGVGSYGLLPAFRPDYITVSAGGAGVRSENTVIAVTKEKISGGEYSALLNSLIFEGGSFNEKACLYAEKGHGRNNVSYENEAAVGKTVLCKQSAGASGTAYTRAGGGADLSSGRGRCLGARSVDSSQSASGGIHSKKI